MRASLFFLLAATAVPLAAMAVPAPAAASEATLRAQTRTINRAVGESLRDALGTFRTTQAVNLRIGPSLQTAVLGSLPAGTPLTVTGRSGNGKWAQVQVGERKGYVWNGFLAPD